MSSSTNKWTLKVGDALVVKDAYIQNSDGTAKDLTSLTVTLKVWSPSSSTAILTVTMSVISAKGGQARWTVAASVWSVLVVETYNAQITMTDPDGYEESTESFTIVVKPTP